MKSSELNRLFSAYCADNIAGLDSLLGAVLRVSRHDLQDDDDAQEFTIGVWQALPIDTTSFSSWLRTRLYWQKIKIGQRESSRKEIPVSRLVNEFSGESTEDKLDDLYYRSQPREPEPHRLSELDEFFSEVADMMLCGWTLKEIARVKNLSEDTLKKRLERKRKTTVTFS